MKVGILSIAHMHAFSYAKCLLKMNDVELVGIFDDNEKRGKEGSEQLGVSYYNSLDTFLSTDLDAVIVCSENSKHKSFVIEAARAGKHILCEKPLATLKKDALEMIDVCREEGVKLQTAFPVRYNESMVKAKRAVERGEIGDILSMRGTNRGKNPGGWFVEENQSGGGAVLDHTVHIIDIMRWLLEDEVEEVYAEVDTFFANDAIDDAGLMTLKFRNGVLASHDPSWSRSDAYPAWGDATIEIIGTKGRIYADAFAEHLHVYSNETGYSQPFVGADMDHRLVEDFLRTVRENKPTSITGEDGMHAMDVALAAYRSAKQHQAVKVK
ncbi:Gfo/Idh/MocA family protein [Pontibacillus yanchengensis]|uniref:Dehydrogenase n=1 Tax=Pontibacillus yanchengensis Y32 TaxID=1385514 RepID=A0A0A2TJL3_9BACI|nr:Gfo/Idh/MocA family oxidoreductase [Pontibacillus yanchengensis]KGP74628.1 dehydrogenase [Pontibacillus yanchengensis Y32]